jgi:hypothetical protein
MSDLFAVGDAVAYRDGTSGASLSCHVIKVMPDERYGRTYHIRDASERFERSVLGYTLTRIAPTTAEGAFKSTVDE